MRTTLRLPLVALLLAAVAAPAAAQGAGPTIDDLINLRRPGSPVISPDGARVAYTVREPDWDDNSYDTEIWMVEVATREPRQMTRGPKSSQSPAFTPDGRYLTFVSDRDGKRQVYRMAVGGGEGEKLTAAEEGVNAFAWSPDGTKLAYTAQDPVIAEMKEREKKYGDFRREDLDLRFTHLYVFDVATREATPLTSGRFVVGGFEWSPDGTRIAFDHRASSDPADGHTSDISIVTVATGATELVVSQAGPDNNPKWSPDGRRLAFQSAMAKEFFYYANGVIAAVDLDTKRVESLTDAFDEDPFLVAWTPAGIFMGAVQRTWTYLFHLDPATKAVTPHRADEAWTGGGFSLTPDGRTAAFIASTPSSFPELYAAPVAPALEPVQLTTYGTQIAAWPQHTREVIRWKSQDGAEIEGVLHKPADFQAGRRYPLLIVIHGGPTGVSRPQPYVNGIGYYPIDLWLGRGALVLEPNYRGSAGYGETFRSLNVRNLGIGDAWDVISGIDHLVAQGLADKDRVGAMGWSQGGYISAFLTTKHSDRFKAISVGAGISNWMTYYVNTDIHPFTRQYLKATPWDDPKIYADTSPMTYIKSANTPTLIQHGDGDQRVPPPNAFELYQGLRDEEVPVELVIFKGFGHGLTKPKANRAAMEQNYEWFNKYVWPAATSSQR